MTHLLQFFAPGLLTFLVACSTTKIRTYQKLDPSEMSISLPIGSESVLGDLKDGFIKNGYRVITHRGGVRTKELNGKELIYEDEHKTRYKLYLETRPVELLCMSDEELQYGIYIIDTKTGTDVISMTGKDCGKNIARKLFDALKFRSPE